MGAGLDVKGHLSLASKYLEEGRELIDKDPVQASKKLYKVADEALKALAYHFDLRNVLKKVGGRGRWTVTELEEAVLRISDKLGKWFKDSWDAANYLYV
jgi:ribosomal protein L13E